MSDYESYVAGGCFGPGGVILPASQCGSRAGTTKPAPSPTPAPVKHSSSSPPKHSSSSGGCFAAGGEILPASSCKKLGIPAGTHSRTITAQGTRITPPKNSPPSSSQGGCFAAGGEILPASSCMKYGIPIGTQSQTITAQGTDIRTGMPVSMMAPGFGLAPGGIQKLTAFVEKTGIQTALDNKGQITANFQRIISDHPVFANFLRQTLGIGPGGRITSSPQLAAVISKLKYLDKSLTFTFSGGKYVVRVTPVAEDVGLSTLISGQLNPISAALRFLGIPVEQVIKNAGPLGNLLSKVPGKVVIGPAPIGGQILTPITPQGINALGALFGLKPYPFTPAPTTMTA